MFWGYFYQASRKPFGSTFSITCFVPAKSQNLKNCDGDDNLYVQDGARREKGWEIHDNIHSGSENCNGVRSTWSSRWFSKSWWGSINQSINQYISGVTPWQSCLISFNYFPSFLITGSCWVLGVPSRTGSPSDSGIYSLALILLIAILDSFVDT